MERPIGEKFSYKGYTLVVVEDASDLWVDGCGACVFRYGGCMDATGVVGGCCYESREDGKSVHFEKGGE